MAYPGGRGVKGWSSSCPSLDDAVARLGDLVPGAGEVAERLGDDEPRLVGQLVEHRVVGVLRAKRVDPRRVEERARLALARVAEGPDARAVGRRDGHLDRVLDAVAAADVLDEADRALDRGRRVVLEPERQREEEERLGVGRALDRRVERRVDGEQQVALDVVELARSRRCASRASGRGGTGGSSSAAPACPVEARMCAKTSAGADVRGELAQVAVVPRRLDALEDGRASRRSPYQPTPNPSPFVVSTPSREWRLWSISECAGL